MMANKNYSGTMTLPSRTAVALWVEEISGQISDGTWENSRPHNHYQFWCRLDVTVGPAKLVRNEYHYPNKRNYALTRLHQLKWDDGTYILRDRMMATARLALAGVDPTDRQTLSAAKYMPATFAAFRANQATGDWEHNFIAEAMARVSDEVAEKFYATTYTLKDMNADLKLIMSVMKSV